MSSPDAADEDFRMRVSALKGAISTLGMVGLMDIFSCLEQAGSLRSPGCLKLIKAIDAERLRVVAAMEELDKNHMAGA